MGKNQKKNGYMFYIFEQRNRDQRQGIRRDDSYYGAQWAKLSDEEKRSYRDKANAKPTGRTIQLTSGHVATPPPGAIGEADQSSGQSCEGLDEARMRQLVSVLVPEDQEKAAATTVVLASSNVMVRTMEGRFLPMELGLVKYSLQEGIKSWYHRFTDPGQVPLGYMNKAQTHVDTTHKTPMSHFDQAIGRRNRKQEFEAMLDEVCIFLSDCQFLNKDQPYYLIFTKEDMVEQLRGSLEYYIKTSGHEQMERLWDDERLVVLDMTYLVMRLYAAAGVAMPLPLCADVPNMASFDYTPGSCDYHTNLDNNFCALGVAKRWCYLLSDTLLDVYGLEAIAGKHLPVINDHSIHVEVANDWGVGREYSRKPQRPFMPSCVAGDEMRYPSAAGHEAPAAPVADEGPGRRLDPRISSGRGTRRN